MLDALEESGGIAPDEEQLPLLRSISAAFSEHYELPGMFQDKSGHWRLTRFGRKTISEVHLSSD
jgi:hypothetical protein